MGEDGSGRWALLRYKQLQAQFPELVEGPSHLALSTDGHQLFFNLCLSTETYLSCSMLAADTATRQVRNIGLGVGWGGVMAPDGRRALGIIKNYHPEDGAYFPTVLFQTGRSSLELESGSLTDVEWLPNGGFVYATDGTEWAGQTSRLVVSNAGGKTLRYLAKDMVVSDLAVSPDAQSVANLTPVSTRGVDDQTRWHGQAQDCHTSSGGNRFIMEYQSVVCEGV